MNSNTGHPRCAERPKIWTASANIFLFYQYIPTNNGNLLYYQTRAEEHVPDAMSAYTNSV